MPRDVTIIFGDLIGKLDVLPVAGDKCGCVGSCRLQRLKFETAIKPGALSLRRLILWRRVG
jgi:hypothetical protein